MLYNYHGILQSNHAGLFMTHSCAQLHVLGPLTLRGEIGTQFLPCSWRKKHFVHNRNGLIYFCNVSIKLPIKYGIIPMSGRVNWLIISVYY